MSYCLNPQCPKAYSAEVHRFCIHCGAKLLLGDRYRALKTISLSGVGRTFIGIDENHPSQNRCIIKQISLEGHSENNLRQALQQFRTAALKLQLLGQHPQIPTLLAYFEGQPQIYPFFPTLVTEYIPGQNIGNHLYSEAEIRQLLEEILPILQFVHDQEIIHRDINPQNFIRTPQGQLYLVDFSTAKVTTKTALAKTGTVIGSAAYTAPEQLRGKATYASDLYSLGAICIHLLTGLHPFELYSNLEGRWVWEDYLTTEISPIIRQIINKMLADALNDRYQTANAIYQDLKGGQTIIPTIIKPNLAPAFVQGNLGGSQWRCFQTWRGHNSSLQTVAFHPQGDIIATGGADRVVKLWNLKEKEAIATLTGHRSIVSTIIFSIDGKVLISGSWDYTIRLWSENTEIAKWEGHSGWVKALTQTPSGEQIISGGADKKIIIWNLKTGTIVQEWTAHEGAVHCLAISPNGQFLASGGADKKIIIWDLSTGERKLILTGHTGSVNALVFSPTGKILSSGSTDGTIKMWRLDGGILLNTLTGHIQGIYALAMSSGGNLLVSGGSDRTLKLWNPGQGTLLYNLTSHTGEIQGLAMATKGGLIASVSQDKTIKLWKFD